MLGKKTKAAGPAGISPSASGVSVVSSVQASEKSPAAGGSQSEALDAHLEREHDWALEQYKTLRQESLQSQSVQHSSLQWGLAVTAASITAGVAIAAKGPDAPLPALVGIELLLFDLAVPLFLLGSCLSWLGEVRRMMRTGIYVRWIEQQVHAAEDRACKITGQVPRRLLSWEHALSGDSASPVKVGGRDWESYVGCALVFGGGQVVTFAIWLSLSLHQHPQVFGLVVPDWALLTYAAVAITLIALTILGVALKRVRTMAKVLGYPAPSHILTSSEVSNP